MSVYPAAASPDQDGSMLFDHASFAYTPSYPDDATGNAAPVYPCWLLPLAQNTLAALADKALEQEITTEPMDRAGTQGPTADPA